MHSLKFSKQPTLPWMSCPSVEASNGNETVLVAECVDSSETQYFWYRHALDVTDSIADLDGIRWWMLLSLTSAWAVVYFVIMKGIQSSGKVVYFTALFPYLVLSVFFVRGLTLKGAAAGIAHMFSPDVSTRLGPI